MKNFILIFSILLCTISCERKYEGPTTKVFDRYFDLENKPIKPEKKKQYKPEEMSQIEFEEISYDFGEIKNTGGKVNHFYKYQNTGNLPLTIVVKPGCGCTAGEYNKEPIPPGAIDSVELIFNPKAFNGKIQKVAHVQGNFPEDINLRFSANVIQ